jgi:DHA1 family bicyclomycin/chloramphenicol resistance-like MFS transporter
MKPNVIKPELYLLILIAGLPQLSETVYTPSLPDMARDLHVSNALIEHTLSIYLLAFSVGTLFWGWLSDHKGRRPCVLMGLVFYILGCFVCFVAPSIHVLFLGRFIQGFGGSIGSVLAQAITRDAFHGSELGRVYSSIGSAMAFFPAIGPVIGGSIVEFFHWSYIFIFLLIAGFFTFGLSVKKLSETHTLPSGINVIQVLKKMIKDKRLIRLGIIVAGCNGMIFSYFGEGSFMMTRLLGLSPFQYGMVCAFNAVCLFLGAMLSRFLLIKHEPLFVLRRGIELISLGSLIFCLGCIWPSVYIVLGGMFFICGGISMTTSNTLAIALVDYRWCTGTASAFFGCFYYVLISFFMYMMGGLHNGSFYPMPLYFVFLSVLMLLMRK